MAVPRVHPWCDLARDKKLKRSQKNEDLEKINRDGGG